MRNVFKILVTTPKRKRPLGTPRWDNNIKADVKEVW
jgi:hypothetical protein